jgi:imidazolonepropionase-like amidohydrolase
MIHFRGDSNMLAIINARLETISNGTIENGKILIKDGKILDIGKDIDVSNCSNIVDAKGRSVTPGIIDAHTHAGLLEQGIGWEGSDINESTDPVTPWCSARDGINMQDKAFENFRKSGITRVGVYPGSANILGGTALALKCKGTIVDEAVIKDPIGMKVALGENPKNNYGNNKKSPATRMANAAVLREALWKAKQYLEKQKQTMDKNAITKRDKQSEALRPVMNKEIPLLIHCHRHDDIVTAVRICNEFDVRYVLEHVTDGHLIIDFLKKQNTHCSVGPTLHYGSKVENRDRDFKTPIYFAREGIPFSFTTDHPVVDARNLMLTASIAVQWGMKEESALRAVTLGSAEHIGIEDRVGSLEIGKDADLVLWSANPLEFTSFVDITIIDGKIVFEREVEQC